MLDAMTDEPKRRWDLPTYVYVLKCDKFTKIGIAVDPADRVRLLQKTCPLEIRIFGGMLFDNYNTAIRIERELHRLFADFRGYGEWFEMRAQLAINALHHSYSHLQHDPGDGYRIPLPERVLYTTRSQRAKRKARNAVAAPQPFMETRE